MHESDLTIEEKRYNTESTLLDSLYEFHPNFFDNLTDADRKVIKTYYLTGKELPENVFIYRSHLLMQYPDIAQEAETVFRKLLNIASMKDFAYDDNEASEK